MLGDILAGRGATRDWMSIDEIDRDMVRAAIAAEDSKFCQHSGFDVEAIENAMQRNASGGRIRGGSTISQQTAKNAFAGIAAALPQEGVLRGLLADCRAAPDHAAAPGVAAHRLGDRVAIGESRPLSKRKRWVLTRVVRKALEV